MGKKRKKKGQRPVEGIPLPPDIVEGLNEQFRRFEEKFGRPPGQDDPIFFDPARRALHDRLLRTRVVKY